MAEDEVEAEVEVEEGVVQRTRDPASSLRERSGMS